MKVKFLRSEPVVDHIRTFWFKPLGPVHYTAGQYTEIKLPHPDTDDRGDKRWFTISSSPSEPNLSITTKFSQPGSSFKRTLAALKPGTELSLANPMGDFVLPKDTTIPLVFVAGGMGITPMHSIIKWLTDTNENRHIILLYAAHSETELAFLPLLEAYCAKVIKLLPDADGQTTRLTATKILDITQPTKDALIYLSGPEPMVEDIVEQFKQTDVSEERLVTDYFPGYEPV